MTESSSSALSSDRPTWHEYFMGICDLVSSRSTCIRRKVGAVLVKEKRLLCSGYNGAPANVPHCRETGCLREKLNVPSGEKHELCRGVHAEQNAIIQAALHGSSTRGATLYTTANPCSSCAKIIANAGIIRVVCRVEHHDLAGVELLKKAGVRVEITK